MTTLKWTTLDMPTKEQKKYWTRCSFWQDRVATLRTISIRVYLTVDWPFYRCTCIWPHRHRRPIKYDYEKRGFLRRKRKSKGYHTGRHDMTLHRRWCDIAQTERTRLVVFYPFRSTSMYGWMLQIQAWVLS